MNKNNRMSKRLLNYVIVLLVCLISSAESFAQGTKFQVKGNVTDASREPIVGATIKVKGTSQGVITNIDGEYSIDTRSNAILEFSYIGYVSQEVPVSGSKIINVTLQEEVSKLDEVVVVGYGTQKKISVTGSALAGGLSAFLLYNFHPAKVFMGDTGSLFLGGMVCGLAFALNIPLVIPIIGLVYVAEVLSDIIQVVYFKKTGGKRFFRMAPLHHHLEMGGWSETKLFCVFSGLTLVLCVVAFLGVMNRYPV